MRDRPTTLRARRLRQDSTVAERALWDELRGRRFNNWKFRRQFGLAGYVVDFACQELNLVVEIDGPVHDEPEQAAFDKRRDAEIEGAGYAILRIDEAMVRKEPSQALLLIQHVGRRIEQGLPPFPDDAD